jgi:trk system potassium uptake protein TrkA
MQIIVVGYGRVGSRTARVLAEEGYDVVVVDNNHLKVERAREQGLTVVEGDGTDEEVLKEAGIETADALGGITGDVDSNHEICLIGQKYDCRTVLRISEDVSTDVYETYAADADEVIYPQRLGAAGAKTALLGGSLNAIGDLTERLQLTVLTVEESSPVVGSRISEIELPTTARLYAHGRKRDPMTIPLPTTAVEVGDRLALLIEQEALDEVQSLLLGDE